MTNHLTYLFLILVWAIPVIVLQWLLGARFLVRRWQVLVIGVSVPTIYLTLIDSVALHAGTWTISPLYTLNVFVPLIGVPIEEAVFFLVTNMMLIQGLILFMERSQVQARVVQFLASLKREPKKADSQAHSYH